VQQISRTNEKDVRARLRAGSASAHVLRPRDSNVETMTNSARIERSRLRQGSSPRTSNPRATRSGGRDAVKRPLRARPSVA
jgi:hypothetical protein